MLAKYSLNFSVSS